MLTKPLPHRQLSIIIFPWTWWQAVPSPLHIDMLGHNLVQSFADYETNRLHWLIKVQIRKTAKGRRMESSEEARQWNEARIHCSQTAEKSKVIGVVLSYKLPWCRKLSNYTWAKSAAKRKSWKAIVLWLLRKQKPLGRAVAHLPREWVVLGRAGNYLASWRWKIISKTKTI